MYVTTIIFIIAVIAVQVQLLESFRTIKYFRPLVSRTPSLIVLKEAIAVETDETIDPAFYTKDLYNVLGVRKNATKLELKEAYWSIAAINHPDRNSSQAALEIFRNASHAYKVLGKDPKTRREYDASLNTKQFVDVVKEVGSEIVVPLTMDVAVPLINLTVQSIGSVAIPFLRDAFEQSSAIFKAAMSETDTEEDDTGLDIIAKTAQNVVQARESVLARQKVRRLREQLDKATTDLAKTAKLLEETKVKELETNAIKEDHYKMSSSLASNLEVMDRSVNELMGAFTDAKKEGMVADESYHTHKTNLSSLLNRSQELTASITDTRVEIERLEIALQTAKSKLVNLTEELSVVSAAISPERQSTTELLMQLELKTTTRDILSSRLQVAQSSRQNLQNEVDRARQILEESMAVASRQQEYREILERKVSELRAKRLSLEGEHMESQAALNRLEVDRERQRERERWRQKGLGAVVMDPNKRKIRQGDVPVLGESSSAKRVISTGNSVGDIYGESGSARVASGVTEGNKRDEKIEEMKLKLAERNAALHKSEDEVDAANIRSAAAASAINAAAVKAMSVSSAASPTNERLDIIGNELNVDNWDGDDYVEEETDWQSPSRLNLSPREVSDKDTKSTSTAMNDKDTKKKKDRSGTGRGFGNLSSKTRLFNRNGSSNLNSLTNNNMFVEGQASIPILSSTSADIISSNDTKR